MNIRKATLSDLPAMKLLFVDTIESVCKADYNEVQIKEWTSSVNNLKRWTDVVENQLVLLSIIDEKITGFGTLKNGDYIDFFYIHKDFQRQGIAGFLLTALEKEAQKFNTKQITSDISITAKVFFKKNGYVVEREQHNERNGVVLVNYKMKKQL